MWLDALWCSVRFGVTPNEYISFTFYRFNDMERRSFYTARQAPRYERKLNDLAYWHTFWDKQLFNTKFKDYVQRDWLYTPGANDIQILQFLKQHEKIVIKPTSLSSGRRVHLYHGEPIEELVSGQYLLEEWIVQNKEMAGLNDSSVNSVRIYTIVDQAGIPHILSASIRVGGIGSIVDNYHSGGIGYPLDCDTDVVCAAGTDLAGE